MARFSQSIYDCMHRCLDAHSAAMTAAGTLTVRYAGEASRIALAQQFLDCAANCYRTVMALRSGQLSAMAVAANCADQCDRMADVLEREDLQKAETLRECASACDALLVGASVGRNEAPGERARAGESLH